MSEIEHTKGWLLLCPDAVPDGWRDRAVDVRLVPLLPDETRELLMEGRVKPLMSEQEVAIARLAAKGLHISEIALELHVSQRTVARRLDSLHRALGTTSKEEMAVLLAERGFSI